MQVVHERCCGLDVHKKTVVACVLITHPDGTVQQRVRTFATMTPDLLALSDWLRGWGATHVAMESTGVYWPPVFNILEEGEGRTILLVNVQRIKTVPGRKTDVRDAEWLADLLHHGLLSPSFIPPAPIRALRELTRYRKTLVEERTAEVNRLQKVLESANLKLACVATDVLGASGRDMLAALLGGEQDPAAVAELARGKLRAKLPDLRRALVGRVQPHHLVLISRILAHVDFLEQSIAEVQEEIDRSLAPFEEAVTLLDTIPSVGAVTAATIIAEIGTDMRRFPSAQHVASWAGLCPGNKQSGGKRRSGKTTHGHRWLRAVLGEVAWSIARSPGTYLHAQYPRIARRRGKNRAIVTVAHSVLVIAYHILTDKRPYSDLGADYVDTLDTARIQRHHVQRLEQLGFTLPGDLVCGDIVSSFLRNTHDSGRALDEAPDAWPGRVAYSRWAMEAAASGRLTHFRIAWGWPQLPDTSSLLLLAHWSSREAPCGQASSSVRAFSRVPACRRGRRARYSGLGTRPDATDCLDTVGDDSVAADSATSGSCRPSLSPNRTLSDGECRCWGRISPGMMAARSIW